MSGRRLPLAELGALVVCLEELERRKPACGALATRDALLDAQLRPLTPEQVRAHFRWVPGREGEPLWCRAPREGDPPYRWVMGSPRQEDGRWDDEGPAAVTLTEPFWIGATPVTLTQYELMLDSEAHGPIRETVARDAPVTRVSWFEASLYCSWLERQRRRSDIEDAWKEALAGVPVRHRFGLPTDAQWEFACRAWWPRDGRAPRFWSGDTDEDLARVGWYDGNSDARLHPVAEREDTANEWGLYDVHGNVWEWCLDWFEAELGGGSDPIGPRSGVRRVQRGGSFRLGARYCRSAFRIRNGPGLAWDSLGFRVCLSAPSSEMEDR